MPTKRNNGNQSASQRMRDEESAELHLMKIVAARSNNMEAHTTDGSLPSTEPFAPNTSHPAASRPPGGHSSATNQQRMRRPSPQDLLDLENSASGEMDIMKAVEERSRRNNDTTRNGDFEEQCTQTARQTHRLRFFRRKTQSGEVESPTRDHSRDAQINSEESPIDEEMGHSPNPPQLLRNFRMNEIETPGPRAKGALPPGAIAPGAYLGQPGQALQRLEHVEYDLMDGGEISHADSTTPTPVDTLEEHAQEDKEGQAEGKDTTTHWSGPIGLVAIGLTFCFALILSVVLSLRGGAAEQESPNPTEPAFNDTLLKLLPDDTHKVIKTGKGPQAKAYQWLAEDPSLIQGKYFNAQRIRQRFGLATFYYSMGGSRWNSSTNWLGYSVHECDWFGLQCNNQNSSSMDWEVHTVELSENRLLGTLPDEIFSLTNLATLDLESNKLLGSFPTQLSKLTKLEKLQLGHNELEGYLPTELGLLTNLTILDAQANNLVGEIPSQLGMLGRLEDLYLSRNKLSGIISTPLGNLNKLVDLFLNANELTGTISSKLGRLVSLDRLDLGANQLSGSIPSELGSLSMLYFMDLSFNKLSGRVPSELGLLEHMEMMYLYHNSITGSIPSELQFLKDLKKLDLGQNNLSGSLPSELGFLKRLEELRLGPNDLSDSIPSQLGNLENLNVLDLSFNELSGNLPSELGSLSQAVLHLWHNELTGAVPPELFRNDLEVHLDDNELTGPLP